MTEKTGWDHDLVCVLFPGIVKNDERALECLGGIKNISEVNVLSTKNKLGVSFQPENLFVKKAYADTKKTAGVLLKVKVKKKRTGDEVKREVISTTVLGRVAKIFRFEGMFDFQYLPISTQEPLKKPQCILDTILPYQLETTEYLNKDAELFVVPPHFTKLDKAWPYRYTFRKAFQGNARCPLKFKKKKISHIFNFNLIDEVPSEPNHSHMEYMKMKMEISPRMKQDYETVKKKFEERPIWSFNAINFFSQVKKTPLRYILPGVAYYMLDGPWFKLWVRYGYDPRKHPEARMYQMLDFRVRETAGVRSMVVQRYKEIEVKKADRAWSHQKAVSQEISPEENAVYRPGILLTQRQIYYQYCDLKLPEVEELVQEPPPPGYLCHPTRGWLPPNTADICRDHIFRDLKKNYIALYQTDLKFERPSSDEEQNYDDEFEPGTSKTDA